MARDKRKRVGCLTGCLVRPILLLGALAMIFVAMCLLGIIRNDPETNAPTVSLDALPVGMLPEIPVEGFSLGDFQLPAWPYAVARRGLTVKTLDAGEGEAVLVCADGYTMLLGAGSGTGRMLCGQLYLCGALKLDAVVAMGNRDEEVSAMPLVLRAMKPKYLLYQNSQIKGRAYQQMMDSAEALDLLPIVGYQGLTFELGRAKVTVVGPARTGHADDRDDGLSVRIDYGDNSVLVMGSVTGTGESELAGQWNIDLKADALICARGGEDNATPQTLIEAVQPQIALMTGKNASSLVSMHLLRAGASVYAARDNGVMTLYSNGDTINITP